MIGIGTFVNSGAIIAGAVIGKFCGARIPERFKKIIFSAVGVAVMFIGIMGVINNAGDSMMLVLSLVLGGLLGEALRLEDRMEQLGEFLKKKVTRKPAVSAVSDTFAEGFMNASIIFVVGAMAIIGSMNDGLLHDPSMLFTKAILDGVTSIVLASSLGIGVAFSALSVFFYQGLLTLLAGVLAPYLTDALIRNMSFVGNAIIFCIGVNFIWPKKIKTGNLFPAMFFPVLLGLFIK